MIVYQLLILPLGEIQGIYQDGIFRELVFKSKDIARQYINLFCEISSLDFIPEYYEIMELEVDENNIEQIYWTRD